MPIVDRTSKHTADQSNARSDARSSYVSFNMREMLKDFIGDCPPDARARTKELCALAQAGDMEARDLALRANAPLASSFLEKALHRCSNIIEDYFQEAMIALDDAVMGFDASRGLEFSTCAHKYMFNRLVKFAPKLQKPISFPACTLETRNIGSPARKAMETPFYDVWEQDSDTLGLEPCNKLDDLVHQEDLQRMRSCFEQLDARTQDILNRRLDGESLLSISKDYGLCRERIRQLEEGGVKEMALALGADPEKVTTIGEQNEMGPSRRLRAMWGRYNYGKKGSN